MLGGAAFEPAVFLRARVASPAPKGPADRGLCRREFGFRTAIRLWNSWGWQGSRGLVGIAAANCFLVIQSDRPELAAAIGLTIMTTRAVTSDK